MVMVFNLLNGSCLRSIGKITPTTKPEGKTMGHPSIDERDEHDLRRIVTERRRQYMWLDNWDRGIQEEYDRLEELESKLTRILDKRRLEAKDAEEKAREALHA